MTRFQTLRRALDLALAVSMAGCIGSINAAHLDPAACVYKLPSQIQWVDSKDGGSAHAYLYGDPSKPGLYIYLQKWRAHHFSKPHSHPNDRFITVLSGTWWVGTGSKFDAASMVAMPAGSFVTHFARQVHYDGAKDEDTILEIVGQGPATAIPATP
jgi:quercetin dioxygenase-like cupin family protein